MLSVVIPAYNEEAMIEKTASVIGNILHESGIRYELLFVDDGSKDGEWEIIKSLAASDARIRGVSFSRNFGKEAALAAGLDNARGECCVFIDCDLQHPPELIPEMYAKWKEGYEVVEAVKRSRGEESRLHAFCAKSFYSIISRATGIDMQRASDYKLLDRKAVDALRTLKEPDSFFRALSAWVGFKTTSIEFDVRERTAGQSKWSNKALLRYALSNITAFSDKPLQFAAKAGLAVLAAGVIAGIFLAAGAGNEGVRTALAFIAVFALGCGLVGMGVLGYYVAKIYWAVKGRPKYIISETV